MRAPAFRTVLLSLGSLAVLGCGNAAAPAEPELPPATVVGGGVLGNVRSASNFFDISMPNYVADVFLADCRTKVVGVSGGVPHGYQYGKMFKAEFLVAAEPFQACIRARTIYGLYSEKFGDFVLREDTTWVPVSFTVAGGQPGGGAVEQVFINIP